MKVSLFVSLAVLAVFPACSGSGSNATGDTPAAIDVPGVDTTIGDTATTPPREYAGSASYGDLVVFTVDPAASTCTVVNSTTSQTVTHGFTVLGGEMAGVLKVQQGADVFHAVELGGTLIAANFPTGNPGNLISFGVSSVAGGAAIGQNLPGDYVYIHISGTAVNGSTNIKEWGVVSIIDDGSFRVKAQATAPGNGNGPAAMAPEEFAASFPVETPDLTGTWAMDAANPVRMLVTMAGADAPLIGFAYAPDPNAIFVLDMGEGNGFILALKRLPTMTLANLAGTYKFINVYDDKQGGGRSAGKAVIHADGTGSYGHENTEGSYSTGVLGNIAACPALPNMFHAESQETTGGIVQTLKMYFVLLPYAYMGFNFRTDGEFRFVGYSVGARID
jgi:hypothetical protein